MKFKIAALIFSVFFSSTIFANSLDKLKITPATKYEIGKLRLEVMGLLLTQSLKGERIGKNFKVERFGILERSGKLFLVGDLIGKEKYITDEQCTIFINAISKSRSGSLSNLPKELWPELSTKQHQQLKEDVKLSIKLIAKDNQNLFIQC